MGLYLRRPAIWKYFNVLSPDDISVKRRFEIEAINSKQGEGFNNYAPRPEGSRIFDWSQIKARNIPYPASQQYKLALLVYTDDNNLLYESATPDELYTLQPVIDYLITSPARNLPQYANLENNKKWSEPSYPALLTNKHNSFGVAFLPNLKVDREEVSRGKPPFDYETVEDDNIVGELYDFEGNKIKDLTLTREGQYFMANDESLESGVYYARYVKPFVNENTIYLNDGNNFRLGDFGYVQPLLKTNDVVITNSFWDTPLSYNLSDKGLEYSKNKKGKIKAQFFLNDDWELRLKQSGNGKLDFFLMKDKMTNAEDPRRVLCGKGYRFRNTTATINEEPDVKNLKFSWHSHFSMVTGVLDVTATYSYTPYSKNEQEKQVEINVKADFDRVITAPYY
jgi:hypothetical protein